jgi:hypothetical protein
MLDTIVMFIFFSLVFYNDEIGEFWYELNLISTNPRKVELQSMSAPLGG